MANDLVFKPLPGDWLNGNDLKVVEVLKISGPPGVNALLYTCNVNIDMTAPPPHMGPPARKLLTHLPTPVFRGSGSV